MKRFTALVGVIAIATMSSIALLNDINGVGFSTAIGGIVGIIVGVPAYTSGYKKGKKENNLK